MGKIKLFLVNIVVAANKIKNIALLKECVSPKD
jgi:hypothetical protein